MNLKRQLLLFAIIVAASFSVAATTFGQTAVIPVHASPYTQPEVQPVFDGAIHSLSGQQPSFNQRAGFTQFMEHRNAIGSWADYTPELIGTYEPLSGHRARQIGFATVSDYVLGHGKHSPLNSQGGVTQAGFFEPVSVAQVAQLQPTVQSQPTVQLQPTVQVPIGSGNSFFNETGVSVRQDAGLDEAPRLFRDQNIGGGRSIFTAFWDQHWTRMVMIYGGFGNSEDNNADIFDGQASTNLGLVGVDIGRRHSRFMRSSIDFTYRGGDVEFQGAEAGQVRVYSLMKNFHLDLARRRGKFRPYIGLGIGGGVLDASASLGDDFVDVQDEGGFAYQIIGGVAANVSDLAALYAEYRYFSITNLDVGSNTGIVEGDFTSHDVLFGLRFGF